MIRRLLLWLSARLPVREIKHQGEPYLERYHVGTLFGYWRVYIHRFVGSDPDGLHAHPWRWGFTAILVGWYTEQRRFGHRVVRWCGFVNGDTFHRVIKPEGADVWTLFIHSPRIMRWGFLRQRAGVTVYEEVNVRHPKPHGDWHLCAPKGRDIRRPQAVPSTASVERKISPDENEKTETTPADSSANTRSKGCGIRRAA